MPDQSVILPFKLRNLFVGFAEGVGVAKVDSSELLLEWVVKDSFFELFKSDMKEVHIPRKEIGLVRLKDGWLGAKVFISPNNMEWSEEFPTCATDGEITLDIERSNLPRARDFVQFLGGA